MNRLYLGTDTPSVINQEIKMRMNRTPDMQELVEEGNQLVFVYGTLKKGFGNHTVLGTNPIYLGKARTQDMGWIMYDTGSFPVVMKTGDVGHYIYGEVYMVPPKQMLQLDGLESNGSMYQRERVKLRLLDQTESDPVIGSAKPIRKAWMYIGVPGYWDDRTHLSLLERQPVIDADGKGLIGGLFFRSF